VHSPDAAGGGTWDPYAFLNSDTTGEAATTSSSSQTSASNIQSETQPVPRSDLFPNGQIIKSLKSVSSSDLVLDVSNGNDYSRSHIKGALLIPSKSFLNDDGTIKSVPEMIKILGNAGISRNDSVAVYSDNLGEAAFTFSVLRYLGQDNVKVLDGNLNDWIAAGLPSEASQNIKPATEYSANPRSEILADYNYVKNGAGQVIDSRSFTEFSKGHIPGSLFLDSANVLLNGKVRDGNDLANMFSRLKKNEPVIVYSGEYYQASLLSYALQLMGYKASIYTWEDWVAHQPASEKKETRETVVVEKSTANTDRFKKLGRT
jgi:thiosulfate/3-mercaptopyruvate sulfurtransferase